MGRPCQGRSKTRGKQNDDDGPEWTSRKHVRKWTSHLSHYGSLFSLFSSAGMRNHWKTVTSRSYLHFPCAAGTISTLQRSTHAQHLEPTTRHGISPLQRRLLHCRLRQRSWNLCQWKANCFSYYFWRQLWWRRCGATQGPPRGNHSIWRTGRTLLCTQIVFVSAQRNCTRPRFFLRRR